MVEYKGIDKVDARALSLQRSLMEALWLTLQSQGVEDGTSRSVECCFVAREDSAVAALLKGIPETADWNHEVSRIDDSPAPFRSRSFLHLCTSAENHFWSSSM
jgi:hypothetical protein